MPGYKTLRCFISVMASGGPKAGLKASFAESSDQQPVFKRFIIEFVKELGVDDRKAFRFWCRGLIPAAKLSYIEVEDDGGLFKLIEFLQDNNHLSFNNMSFLKKFLSVAKRRDLLEALEKAELTIVISEILDYYKRKVFYQGSERTAGNFHADVVQLLISTKEKSLELIQSQVLEHVRGLDFLEPVIHSYLLRHELSWSRVTAVLVILADISTEADKEDLQTTTELLAESIRKLGGMVSFNTIIAFHLCAKVFESINLTYSPDQLRLYHQLSVTFGPL